MRKKAFASNSPNTSARERMPAKIVGLLVRASLSANQRRAGVYDAATISKTTICETPISDKVAKIRAPEHANMTSLTTSGFSRSCDAWWASAG